MRIWLVLKSQLSNAGIDHFGPCFILIFLFPNFNNGNNKQKLLAFNSLALWPCLVVSSNIKCEGQSRQQSDICFLHHNSWVGEKEIGTEEEDWLKIAPDPVTSEGVTVGKTHQGDHAFAPSFAYTHPRFRNISWQVKKKSIQISVLRWPEGQKSRFYVNFKWSGWAKTCLGSASVNVKLRTLINIIFFLYNPKFYKSLEVAGAPQLLATHFGCRQTQGVNVQDMNI